VGRQKYQADVPKARNLTWALLAQALLNDKKLSIYLEDYGSSLVKEATFRDILKQLIGGRVAPLLKELLSNPAYQDKVVQEKYDFLRATEAFKKIDGNRNGQIRLEQGIFLGTSMLCTGIRWHSF